MKSKIKWYSIETILQKKAQYYMVLGERSNGKSFSTQKYIVDKFFKSECKSQFAYVMRYDEDIKGQYMNDVFKGDMLDYIRDEYNHELKYYQGKFLVYECDTDPKLSNCKVFGKVFAVSMSARYKGKNYPEIDTILFEEFMEMKNSYLNDEVNLLLNLVSTIVRFRTNVKVIMLANTITKHCPYLSVLNLKAHRLKKGETIVKTYVNSKGQKTTFAIERTENVDVFDNEDNKEKIVYNNFGDSGVGAMITTGEFETHKYRTSIDNISNTKVCTKRNKLPLVLQYEDYYYSIFAYSKHVKIIFGFKEINRNTINAAKYKFMLGGKEYYQGIENIHNVLKYDNKKYNKIFDYLVNAINQENFVVDSDDDGENVINGLRLCGISYINK